MKTPNQIIIDNMHPWVKITRKSDGQIKTEMPHFQEIKDAALRIENALVIAGFMIVPKGEQ